MKHRHTENPEQGYLSESPIIHLNFCLFPRKLSLHREGYNRSTRGGHLQLPEEVSRICQPSM